MEACTWYAMRECFALYYRCAPEDVDMAALFPETRDYAPVFAEHPIPRPTCRRTRSCGTFPADLLHGIEAGHPEVEGLTAWAEEAGGKVDVVAAPEEIPEGLYDPVGVVAQTTQRRENLEAVVAALREAGGAAMSFPG